MRKIYFLLLVIVCSLCATSIQISAQESFSCTGDFFLSLSLSGSSTSQFFRVSIDPISEAVNFGELAVTSSGANVNGIGYRITDNLIYGVGPSNFTLYQIDATGTAVALTTLSTLFNEDFAIAGDITPDGNYLVELGRSGTGLAYNDKLYKIDLTDPDYSVSVVNLTTNTGLTSTVQCADIAFDPLTGILYGFDSNNNRFVTFDMDNALINTNVFPVIANVQQMGALFFDPFGAMYGYGAQVGGGGQNTLFSINKNTGLAVPLSTGPTAQGNDGCSCPYTVSMQKEVFPTESFPCTEIYYRFLITNASGTVQTGVNFSDVLPQYFTITEIANNPFGGTITGGGIGTGFLEMENLTLPLGIDSLVVRAEIGEFAFGTYRNQAMLTNLPEALGDSVLSDDPNTIIEKDSTTIEVIPFSIEFLNDTLDFCLGDVLSLDASAFGVTYEWNDGSTGETLTVTEGGNYWFKASTNCETTIDSIFVIEQFLDTTFPTSSINIVLGDSLQLLPEISTNANNYDFNWSFGASSVGTLSCADCLMPYALPFYDATYILNVTAPNGCTAIDSVQVLVDRNRYIAIPNAFSPNDDGWNDTFFIKGQGVTALNTFKVFNRLGELVFEVNNAAGLPSPAWDGTHRQRPADDGVYVWYAEMSFVDGLSEVFKGNVTLVR